MYYTVNRGYYLDVSVSEAAFADFSINVMAFFMKVLCH